MLLYTNSICITKETGSVTNFPGADKFEGDLLIEQCDILVPAAGERVITAENAEQVFHYVISCVIVCILFSQCTV